MKKIDWFILGKFLGTFFYAIMIFTVIAVVIDITEKIDNFIDHHLTVSFIVTHYYIDFVPYIVALLFPLFIFIAVIFFTSKMAYRLEVMAILSSGVSFWRFLRPYWVGGILMAGLLGVANQTIVPMANRARNKFEDRYVNDNRKKQDVVSNIHMRIDSVTYISIDNFYINTNYASGFTLEKIRGQQLLSKLETSSLSWDSAHQSWRTGRAVLHVLDGSSSVRVASLMDTTLKLSVAPKDLLFNTDAQESMTTAELNRYIKRQQLRGAGGLNYLFVEKYRRVASAFAVIILTFIGAVISSRKVRGGSGLHLALGIVISAAYILFMQFSTTFSVKGNLSPLISVWIPNFIFAGIAALLYRRAPK